ncbi:GAF domain-containing protein [Aquabacterium sp. J223]|uniref:GAF domain-containing protein n=1 Tax=Aquabacterium sp. J223 TaxID=2898431 RepID=UPI0021AE2840|nr:GAF domain-containing protein [Aquabacterium sp. J223]UUX97875.1 GAF domain-containing protein [Aquabacterium sp. J223]
MPLQLAVPRPARAVDGRRERARLAALDALHIVDAPREPGLYRLVVRLAERLQAPMAALSLVTSDRQVVHASVGLGLREVRRSASICSQVVFLESPLVVEDLAAHPVLRANPYVVGEPRLRAYAGAPLLSAGGEPVGVLCAMDTQPRTFTGEDRGELVRLAQAAACELIARAWVPLA